MSIMVEDIIEVEDFLPKMYVDKINQDIAEAENFNWNLIKNITFKGESETFPSFTHMAFKRDEGIVSDCFEFLYPLVCMIPEKTGIEVKELHRLRLGLIVKQPKKEVHPAHIDMPGQKHYTALYYINESDGDTYIYDQVDGEDPSKFTIKKRIKPKKNKIAIIDGKYYHSSSSCVRNNKRVVLTINFS